MSSFSGPFFPFCVGRSADERRHVGLARRRRDDGTGRWALWIPLLSSVVGFRLLQRRKTLLLENNLYLEGERRAVFERSFFRGAFLQRVVLPFPH